MIDEQFEAPARAIRETDEWSPFLGYGDSVAFAKAALAAAEAAAWQPIETAPKEGTGIVGSAWWKMADGVYCLGWLAEGYFDGDDWAFASFDLDADEYSAPTHWMPLPQPPKEKGDD